MLKSAAILISFFALGISNSGCTTETSECDCLPPQERLAGTWRVQDVTLGSVSKKADYAGFQLIIEVNGDLTLNYERMGTPEVSPWPLRNGTMKLGTDPETQLIRIEDGLNMAYAVTDTQLELTFMYSSLEPQSEPEPGKPIISDPLSWLFTLKK
jgi:hypothetical protein